MNTTQHEYMRPLWRGSRCGTKPWGAMPWGVALAAFMAVPALSLAQAPASPDALKSLRGPAGEKVRFQVFTTAEALVPDDTNGAPDVYLRDLETGKVDLVSVGPDGKPGAQGSEEPSVSGDGRMVAFVTRNALLPQDENNLSDVYCLDRETREVFLVSRNSAGRAANAPSSQPVVSWDGTYVSFASPANDIVHGDTNWVSDIFLWNRTTRIPRRVNLKPNGEQFDKPSYSPSVSASAVYVGFRSLERLFPEQPVGEFHFYVVEAPGMAGRTHKAMFWVDSENMTVLKHAAPDTAGPTSGDK